MAAVRAAERGGVSPVRPAADLVHGQGGQHEVFEFSAPSIDTRRSARRWPDAAGERDRGEPDSERQRASVRRADDRAVGLDRGGAVRRTIDVLRRSGYEPYLLLEDWEMPLFRDYVSGASQYAELDWPPTIDNQDISRVGVYRLSDRARYLAGAPIVTSRITYAR